MTNVTFASPVELVDGLFQFLIEFLQLGFHQRVLHFYHSLTNAAKSHNVTTQSHVMYNYNIQCALHTACMFQVHNTLTLAC